MTFRPDEWLIQQLVASSDGCPALSEEVAFSLLNWAKAVRERRPVAFIGAGMSLNARPVPRWREMDPHRSPDDEPRALTWGTLADRLRKGLTHDNEAGEADALWLAELYAQRYGREALIREIERAVPDRLLEPGKAHATIFALDWCTILTTNYDTLVERAHHDFRIASRLRICESDLDLVRSAGRQEELELIYLHGVLRKPETIVLSLEDYRQYNRTHAGMLAKVRQLFLQHPVMLVGFSATDPNFVQWSGWISDVVGEHRNPWICLATGGGPGRARRSYWHGALEFIPVDPKHIPTVFRLLGAFCREMDTETAFQHALETVDQIREIPSLIAQLPGLLQQFGGSLPSGSEWYKRAQLLERALRRVFELKYEGQANARWARAMGENRQVAQALRTSGVQIDPDAHPTLQEQSALVRDALGKHWLDWLLVVARHFGPSWWIKNLYFSLLNELNALPSDARPGEVRKLRLALLQARVERTGQADVRTVISEFLGADPLAPEEQELVEDVIQRNLLRAEARTEPSVKDSSVQGLRRRAFFAALDGDFSASAAAYAEAAKRSRDECEFELIEWLTIESADQMLQACSFNDPPKDSPVELEARDELKRRKHWLERQIPDRIGLVRNREQEALQELLKMARESAWNFREPLSTSGHIRTEADGVLEVLEAVWALPWRAARFAEARGQAQWAAGQHIEATRTLARYGSPTLGRWIELEIADARRGPLEPELIDVLLRDGRWPGEWLSLGEALEHVVPECSGEQLSRLSRWLERAAEHKAAFHDSLIRGNELRISAVRFQPLVRTKLRLWSYADPAVMVREWEQWKTEIISMSARSELSGSMKRLPLRQWLQSGRLSPGEADKILGDLLSRTLRTGDIYQFDWVLERVCSLVSNNGGWLLPHDGAVATAISEWLGESAFALDNIQGARTRLAKVLDGPQRPWSLKALTDKILNACCSSSLNSALEQTLLYSLADLIEQLDSGRVGGLVAKLTHSLDRARNESRDEIRRDGLVGAVGRLAAKLLHAGIGEREACERLILECLELSPRSATPILSAGSRSLGTAWPTVQEHVAEMFLGGSVLGGDIARTSALGALNELMIAEPDAVPPADWWYGACTLTRAENTTNAGLACNVLSNAAELGVLRVLPPDMWQQWFRALRAAAGDGRAALSGAAGRALRIGLEVLSEAATDTDRQRILELLARMKTDPRVGVQTALDEAEEIAARIRSAHAPLAAAVSRSDGANGQAAGPASESAINMSHVDRSEVSPEHVELTAPPPEPPSGYDA